MSHLATLVGGTGPTESIAAVAARVSHLWRATTRARIRSPVPRGGCARRDKSKPVGTRATSDFELWVVSWVSQPRLVLVLLVIMRQSKFDITPALESDPSPIRFRKTPTPESNTSSTRNDHGPEHRRRRMSFTRRSPPQQTRANRTYRRTCSLVPERRRWQRRRRHSTHSA